MKFITESRACRLLDVATTKFKRLRAEGVVVPTAECGGRRLYSLDAIDQLKSAGLPLELFKKAA